MTSQDKINKWLECQWTAAIQNPESEADPTMDPLINSQTLSIRYALMTQLLGKIEDERRGILYLQQSGEETSARKGRPWDARSFCKNIIVPWNRTANNVLGTSPDPYVNNPLRRSHLEEKQESLKDQEGWHSLTELLRPLDEAPVASLQEIFGRCLQSIGRRLAQQQDIRYQVPQHISLLDLLGTIRRFLSGQSSGLRPMAVSVALLHTLNHDFALFSKIESQQLYESDSAKGRPADILCFSRPDESKAVLAIEVKEYELRIADVQNSLNKIRNMPLPIPDLLFAAPSTSHPDAEAISQELRDAWEEGISVHVLSIPRLIESTFALLEAPSRIRLLHTIGTTLNTQGNLEIREQWKAALRQGPEK